MTLKDKMEYMGAENFKKFENVADFSALNDEDKEILKNVGIPFGIRFYPSFDTDGILKNVSDEFVQIAEDINFKYPLVIEISSGKILYLDEDPKEITLVNNTLERYISCMYAYNYWYSEVFGKLIYGGYRENQNYKKYAKKLRELLNEIEPKIEDYILWEEEIFQIEIGVI